MHKYIIIFFFLINISNISLAQEKIVFINVNYIFANSIAGKEANESLEKKVQNLEKEISKFSSDINTDKEKLAKQKNILSEEDFKIKFETIDKEISEFNKKIKVRNNEIIDLKKKIQSKFAEELRKILSEYSTKNSIELILKQENVLIGSNELNITKEILEVVDSKKIKLLK